MMAQPGEWDAEYAGADSSHRWCNEPVPDDGELHEQFVGYVCSLPYGHQGRHVAHLEYDHSGFCHPEGWGFVCCVWGDWPPGLAVEDGL